MLFAQSNILGRNPVRESFWMPNRAVIKRMIDQGTQISNRRVCKLVLNAIQSMYSNLTPSISSRLNQ